MRSIAEHGVCLLVHLIDLVAAIVSRYLMHGLLLLVGLSDLVMAIVTR